MIFLLSTLFVMVLLGGIALIVTYVEDAPNSAVLSMCFTIALILLVLIPSSHREETIVNNIATGKSKIDTLYTIQNSDTINTTYKLINIRQ